MEQKVFPGAPIKGYFLQIKSLQIQDSFSGFSRRPAKISKIFWVLSRFLIHNGFPYFELYEKISVLYRSKLLPFWEGFLPHLMSIREGNDSIYELYMKKTWGNDWESSEEGIAIFSALCMFTKDNPTGEEKESIEIFSIILWSIYISLQEPYLFDQVYSIFNEAERKHRSKIVFYDDDIRWNNIVEEMKKNQYINN